MKRTTRQLTPCLAGILFCLCWPLYGEQFDPFPYTEQFGLFTYAVNQDGDTLTITDYPEDAVGTVEIPAEIDGLPVTTIGYRTFYNCSSLTSVTIPNSVTTISGEAFSGCSSLTSIAVALGNAHFSSEEGVLFNEGGTTLVSCPGGKAGVYAIPNSVTTISGGAFSGCSSLTSVTIPNGVTTIGSWAFVGCRSLNSIVVASGNLHYVSEEGVLFDFARTTLIQYPGGKAGEYAIPDSVTTIGYREFRDCSSLTSVTIPNSVTTIGFEAFSGCSSLTSVTIPNSVTTIGFEAFSGCSSLTSVTIPNRVTTIIDSTFYNCSSLTSVTIPNSVTTIGREAFYNCSSLTSVTIPNRVTTIGESAFSGCSGLTSVTIPNRVTTIGESAFSGCSGLTSVTIPNRVTTIGWGAFSGCSSLTSVTIPNSVTTIGYYAFRGCSSLTSIAVAPGNAHYASEEGVLFDFAQTRLIQCPGGKAGVYAIPSSVTAIIWGAFWGCSSLTSVTIPNSVTKIGESAFVGCRSLTSIAVAPGNARYASEEGVLFDFAQTRLIQCPGGKAGAYAIPSSVTEIGYGAFTGCTGLTSVTIPNGVTTIGGSVFSNCSSLTSVTIPNSVTTIGERTFSNCSSLTSVTIPNSVTTLGYDAFTGCRSLAVATFLGHAPVFPFTHWSEEAKQALVGPTVIYKMAPDFTETAPNFTVYYLSGSTGFASPEWGGYPARRIDSDPVVDERGVSLSYLALPELSLTPETSIDLKTWTTEGVSLSEIDQNDRRTATIRRDGTNRFLRLVVEE